MKSLSIKCYNNNRFFIFRQKKMYIANKAKETSSLAHESEDAIEDAIETIGNKTQSAWNQTKLAAYDAGEKYWSVN